MHNQPLHRVFLSALALLAALVLVIPGTTASAEALEQQGCPPTAGLFVGGQGVVLSGPDNVMRSQPGVSIYSPIIGLMPAGTVFYVLEGPRCVDGYNWWRVDNGSIIGWTADGDFNRRWVASTTCVTQLGSRLWVGSKARVTPGLPNVIRAMPGSGARLGTIPAGGVMDVIGGPQCANGSQLWWQINYNGVVGWTGEMEGLNYWLEPASGSAPVCNPAPRLRVGTTGTVTPGMPNALRDRPGLNASGSRVIGSLPGGAIFSILSGPTCQDGHYWWQVTAGGQTGWTAEGQAATYWLDPLVCGNGILSRLAPGMNARVTPGLPNNLRSAPSASTGYVLTRIPAGGVVSVLGDFRCDAQGRLWWLVQYAGLTGWTVEGDAGTYWLDPA